MLTERTKSQLAYIPVCFLLSHVSITLFFIKVFSYSIVDNVLRIFACTTALALLDHDNVQCKF